VIPGASAVLAALATSGFPSDMFFFGGFLPPKDKARRDTLHALEAVPGTLILFETAGRLRLALEAMMSIFPRRRIAVARELTKLHEQVLCGTAAELSAELSGMKIKGEIVLLVAPRDHEIPSEEEVAGALREAMRRESTRDAVEKVAKALGVPKKMVYNLSLKMRG
jgi:16S rRNA (cytidine1402-2'-O)-methyltransferase